MTTKVVIKKIVKKRKASEEATDSSNIEKEITQTSNESEPQTISVEPRVDGEISTENAPSTKKKVIVTRRIVRKKDGTVVSSTTTKTIEATPATQTSTENFAPSSQNKDMNSVKRKSNDEETNNVVVVTKQTPKKKLTGWEWYQSIGSPRWVLSPMVGQSELAFRMLCRNHNVQLAYTPMFIASRFVESEPYRRAVWQTCPEDRPLVVQFCGNQPDLIVRAGKLVQQHCDAIDINLGCPQEVARRGGYGSYLMDNLPLVEKIVRAASSELSVPVTVKIRVFESFKKTLAYCKMLQSAGASLITIHGRQRHHREEVLSDWCAADRLRPHLNIPVIVNGDLWHAEDIALCFDETAVDGYMSAQGILHNPGLFDPLASFDKKQKADGNRGLPAQPSSQSSSESNGPTRAKSLMKGKEADSDSFHWAPPVTESALRQRRPIGAIMSHALAFAYNHPLNKQEAALRPDSDRGLAQHFRTPFSTPEDAEKQFELASEYVSMVRKYPVAHPSIARRHLFFMLFDNFQANLDQYDLLCDAVDSSEYERIIFTLLVRAREGKTVKVRETYGDGIKPRSRRRDGSVAPPPWPVGGGGLNVAESEKSKKLQQRGVDPSDAVDDGFEIVSQLGTKKQSENGKKIDKKGKQLSKDENSLSATGLDKSKLRNVDLSKFD